MNSAGHTSRFRLETLEPRILLSGDVPVMGCPEGEDPAVLSDVGQVEDTSQAPNASLANTEALAYHPAAQVNAIFPDPLDETPWLTPDPADPQDTETDAGGSGGGDEDQTSTGDDGGLASDGASDSDVTAGPSPSDVISMTEQLVETLHAANGPPESVHNGNASPSTLEGGTGGGGVHDAALINSLRLHLRPFGQSSNTVSAWMRKFDDPAVLDRELPLIGKAFLDAFKPQVFLDPLLAQVPNQTFASLAALVGALNSVSGLSVTGTRDLPDNLEIDLHISAAATLHPWRVPKRSILH